MRNPPQGRDYSGRPPVGAMTEQGHGFDKGRNTPHLQATAPTHSDVRPTFDAGTMHDDRAA